MSTDTLTIRSQLGDYPVHFHTNFGFLSRLASLPNPVILIDGNVLQLYKETLSAAFRDRAIYVLEATEDHKTLDETARIYQWIIDHFKAKRNIDFISIGGGITQDVSGYVASTLFRGVGWDFVPTTLLAQVDSCIGGKTSLNFGGRKNLLGTFYPPRAIHIASAFTHTLARLDLFSGYGEVAKFLLMRAFESGEPFPDVATHLTSIIGDRAESALAPIIRDCLNVKRSFMESDEFDRGRRNLLNYGHCFGHALEAASKYYVPHGIAVNIGIIFANLAAAARGMITTELARLITREVNLPLLAQEQRPNDYLEDALLENMKNDKKRTGQSLPLVVPTLGGLVKLDDFTEPEFRSILCELREMLFH
ncbi:MAG: 3-dehydroquinate synthase [Lentisphaerae bacterium]|nr:3-dehydroquinate synthase [Lentisphaerota bacterium]